MKALAFLACLLGFERILLITLVLMAIAIAQGQGFFRSAPRRPPQVHDVRSPDHRTHARGAR